jgi:hypothetical protein
VSEIACPDCGHPLGASIGFCTNCGANLEGASDGADVLFAASDFEPQPEPVSTPDLPQTPPEVAPSPVPPVATPQVVIPVSSGGMPHLVMDTGVSARVGENGVLWFGLANGRETSINCCLVVEMDRHAREAFHHFSGDRELRIGPAGEGTVSLSFRAQTAGEFPLSVRLFVEGKRAGGTISFYQVADRCKVYFGISNQQNGGSITVHNEVRIDRNYGGDISIRPEVLRSIQEKMAGSENSHRAAPQELPLEPPELAHGWIPFSRDSLRGSHLRLDAWRSGELQRRFHILIGNELWFGRNDSTQLPSGHRGSNTLAWRWLPCRSKDEDPKHFSNNETISRHHAGVLRADESGTGITCCRSSLQVGTHQLNSNQPLEFHAGSVYRLRLGYPGLEFDISPLASAGEDPSIWLREWHRFAGLSGAVAEPTRHDAVRIDRVNNLEQVSYVMLLQSVSIGGGARDACYVEGLPSGVLRLARCGSDVFLLADPEYIEGGGEVVQKRLWHPVGQGNRFKCGEWSFRFSASSASDTKNEVEFQGTTENP